MASHVISIAIASVALLATVRHVTSTFLCGPELAETVKWVCGERGYYGLSGKRSAPNIFQHEATAKSFLKSLTSGRSHSRPRRTGSRRIVTECCENWCPISTIETYCNPWPDNVIHEESVHDRQGKSAEAGSRTEQPLERPLTEIMQEVDSTHGDSEAESSKGRTRLERIEEVLSERLRPTTSSITPSPTTSKKKHRKDKSERRNTSRAAKQARRDERRRNREKSSGGRSRGGRRRGRVTDRAPRAKRSDLLLWEDPFAFDEAIPIERRDSQESQGIAPFAFNFRQRSSDTLVDSNSLHPTNEFSTSLNDAHIPSRNEEKTRINIGRFVNSMKYVRTLITNIFMGR